MHRYIMTEQFLGAIFMNLIEREIFQIEISKLNELERLIDTSLREMHNTMLDVSGDDIFMLAEEYSDFFEIYKRHIRLQAELSIELERNKVFKDEFVFKLRQYFTSGIPRDINETIINLVNSVV